jgi:hypothetical protein
LGALWNGEVACENEVRFCSDGGTAAQGQLRQRNGLPLEVHPHGKSQQHNREDPEGRIGHSCFLGHESSNKAIAFGIFFQVSLE